MPCLASAKWPYLPPCTAPVCWALERHPPKHWLCSDDTHPSCFAISFFLKARFFSHQPWSPSQVTLHTFTHVDSSWRLCHLTMFSSVGPACTQMCGEVAQWWRWRELESSTMDLWNHGAGCGTTLLRSGKYFRKSHANIHKHTLLHGNKHTNTNQLPLTPWEVLLLWKDNIPPLGLSVGNHFSTLINQPGTCPQPCREENIMPSPMHMSIFTQMLFKPPLSSHSQTGSHSIIKEKYNFLKLKTNNNLKKKIKIKWCHLSDVSGHQAWIRKHFWGLPSAAEEEMGPAFAQLLCKQCPVLQCCSWDWQPSQAQGQGEGVGRAWQRGTVEAEKARQ